MTNQMQQIHPGETLKGKLEQLEMSALALAQILGVPPNRISEIVKGNRGITADTALRLSRFFGTTPEFWMQLQVNYELQLAKEAKTEEIERIKPAVT